MYIVSYEVVYMQSHDVAPHAMFILLFGTHKLMSQQKYIVGLKIVVRLIKLRFWLLSRQKSYFWGSFHIQI